jgi:hypothetical protein
VSKRRSVPDVPPHQPPPRRFRPPRGQLLTLGNIRGSWRASGAVDGNGFFSVTWSTRSGDWWAPLHDFTPADQLRLIEMGREQDHERYGVAR